MRHQAKPGLCAEDEEKIVACLIIIMLYCIQSSGFMVGSTEEWNFGVLEGRTGIEIAELAAYMLYQAFEPGMW